MMWRYLPNALTVLRLALVAPVAVSVLMGEEGIALTLFLIAGVSDALDGPLARRFRWQSHVGGLLDPLADKALVGGTFLALALAGRLPWWFLGVVLLRDLVITGGATIYRLRIGPFRAEPLLIGKLTTLALLGYAFVLLLPWADPVQRVALTQGLLVLCTGLAIVSGAAYVVVWGQQARRARVGGSRR